MLPSSPGSMQQLTMNCNCSYKSSSLFISPTCRISPRNFLRKSVSVSPCTSYSALKMPSPHVKITHAPRSFTRPSAVADAAETEELETPVETEKLGVVVKPMEKPRLVLKFMWMENDIGLALDYVIPGHGTIPISPYYFWPRKDAWEELKVMLESKPWISQKQLIILLNQATDIFNLWQQTTGDL